MSHLDDWAAALVDDELSPDERDRALAHLAGCAECRADVELQRRAKAALAPSGDAPPLAASMTARLLAIPAAPAGVAATDVVRRAPALARRPRGSRPWPGRAARPVPVRRRGRARVAAGSVGALAAALTVAVLAGGDAPGDVKPPVSTFVVEHTATTTQLPLHDPVAGIVMISTR